MSPPDLLPHLVGLVALGALAAYAVLAGPDFGGGVLDLLAGGRRQAEQRAAIAATIGPVWEANHVWLIFLLIVLFTAYPVALADLSAVFFVPFHLVLAGIVLRGAAFGFRSYVAGPGVAFYAWGRIFGIASAITPLLLGATLGATATGAIRIVHGQTPPGAAAAWLMPFPLVLGALTLALCAYLAAIHLAQVTDGDVREDFRRRALGLALVIVVLSPATLVLLRGEAPRLWDGLLGPRAAPVLALALLVAPAAAFMVWRRSYGSARTLAVGEVILLLGAWALAQWPYIIYPDVTLVGAAAPPATLAFLLATVPFGMGLVLPSLWLLFAVFRGRGPRWAVR
jgi:cytochrome bd ubiquinol oxidase subunit II